MGAAIRLRLESRLALSLLGDPVDLPLHHGTSSPFSLILCIPPAHVFHLSSSKGLQRHHPTYEHLRLTIQIRCIFRVIEFTQGYAGTLRTVEWYFYVFDTLPLVLAIAVWIIVWPSKYLGRPAAAAAYAVTGSSSGGLDMGMQMSGRGLNSGASTGSGASGGSGEALTGKEAMRMTEEEVGMTHLGMGHLQQQQRPFQHQNPDKGMAMLDKLASRNRGPPGAVAQGHSIGPWTGRRGGSPASSQAVHRERNLFLPNGRTARFGAG